jgi:hypothetical protein
LPYAGCARRDAVHPGHAAVRPGRRWSWTRWRPRAGTAWSRRCGRSS